MSSSSGSSNYGVFDGLGQMIAVDDSPGDPTAIAQPLNVSGSSGAGHVYDSVYNIPAPSGDAYEIISTNNLLVGTPTPVPPGQYIISTYLTYSGAGKVLPAGAVVQLNIHSAASGVDLPIASYVVPSAITPDVFEDSRYAIIAIQSGDTFTLTSSAGINLGAAGSLQSYAVAFCGSLPAALLGSVRRSR